MNVMSIGRPVENLTTLQQAAEFLEDNHFAIWRNPFATIVSGRKLTKAGVSSSRAVYGRVNAYARQVQDLGNLSCMVTGMYPLEHEAKASVANIVLELEDPSGTIKRTRRFIRSSFNVHNLSEDNIVKVPFAFTEQPHTFEDLQLLCDQTRQQYLPEVVALGALCERSRAARQV